MDAQDVSLTGMSCHTPLGGSIRRALLLHWQEGARRRGDGSAMRAYAEQWVALENRDEPVEGGRGHDA